MTAIVIGASSGLGRALSEQLARTGTPLLLVASDLRDVDALAADLNLRFGVAVRALALDLGRAPDPGARVLESLGALPAPTALLLAIGNSRADDDFSLDAAAIGQLIAINLYVPLAIVHALRSRLIETHGVIVGFGSVAGVRGRGRNVAYAAAKRGLDSLFESLRQRHRPSELRVQFYRLGFLSSNLT
ncbi:MAG: SDR family NAD(P)-dependent oxidoreductase, partial [Rhodanobacteraceae bacterium]